MELLRSDAEGANLIKSLGPGEFRVNDVLYTRSIIVTADKVVDAWTQNSAQDLTIEDFQLIAEFDAEIIIIGTGKTLVFPDRKLLQPFIDQKCGYEFMNSYSACNTFNILIGDGRNVVAALLVDE